jgi:putative colanic acid biosysnthesis UDP-glucose lipid carrier transferase
MAQGELSQNDGLLVAHACPQTPPQQKQDGAQLARNHLMLKDRGLQRTFYSAPQSVTSLLAAFLEPTITVSVFVAVSMAFGEPIGRSDLTLCLLIFALTFPGRNRFWDRPLNAAVDISTSWVSLLAILALCGYATRSLGLFDEQVLMWWALVTPALQWLAVFAGRTAMRSIASAPQNRRTAIVVGAGSLGVKV